MYVIPEDPEQYIEFSKPTPELINLLTTKQFKYYTTANTNQLFGCFNYKKKIINTIQEKRVNIAQKLTPGFEFNKKSLVYLGIGFGILVITKVVKKLSK